MPTDDSPAQQRASKAQQRATKAQQRASAARRRVRFAAANGAVWEILKFFENRTPAAWGALWYLLLSIIGVTYSWAFYSQFEGIHIFDFFGTSDFLLSAFQNVEMLVIGIIATLIGIGILIYRAYDSIVYSAYKFDAEKRKVRILLETVTLMSIALVIIIDPLFYYYPSIWLYPISTGMLTIGTGLGIGMLVIGTNIFAALLTYRFFKRVRNPSKDKQQDQANWGVGILLFMLLAETTVILPFLHGRNDSEAALQDKTRRVQVVVHQDSVQSETRLPKPDRTLLLGTTSSFHFFYECKKPLNTETYSECKKGRPFIVPTAKIASLEFNPELVTCASSATPKADIACAESNPENGNDAPHVDLSHVIEAIAALDTTISNLKFNAIFKMESGNVTFDTTDVANAVTALNQTIAEFKPFIVFDPAQSTQIVQAVTTLNKIVRNFKPTTVPDLDEIVNAINTNTAKITTAIEGIKLPSEVRTHCVSGWKKVMTVGPFREGYDAPNNKGNQNETVKESSCEFVTPDQFPKNGCFPFEAKVPRQLMLVGRADITPLSENQRKYYGSNNGLAQSRAKWVRDQLVEKLKWKLGEPEKKALRERTILLSAGPLHVGQGGEDPTEIKNRAKDRSVEVWACGDPKPE